MGERRHKDARSPSAVENSVVSVIQTQSGYSQPMIGPVSPTAHHRRSSASGSRRRGCSGTEVPTRSWAWSAWIPPGVAAVASAAGRWTCCLGESKDLHRSNPVVAFPRNTCGSENESQFPHG